MKMRRFLALAAALSLCPLGAADFKVLRTDDVVKLVDGTEVRGTVIAVGMKAVIVAVEDREVVVPRSKVESIVRGATRAETLKFTTDPVDGLKVITGRGFRDEKAPAEEEGEVGEAPAEKKEEKRGPARKPGRKPGRKPSGKGLDADALRRLMKRDKRLERMIKMVGGPEKAAELAKNMGEDALKELLGGGKK